MSADKLEALLARLYADERARSRFLADPRLEARRAGLSDEDSRALEKIDRIGLELAAQSFARKRRSFPPRKPPARLKRWLRLARRARL